MTYRDAKADLTFIAEAIKLQRQRKAARAMYARWQRNGLPKAQLREIGDHLF